MLTLVLCVCVCVCVLECSSDWLVQIWCELSLEVFIYTVVRFVKGSIINIHG